MFRSSSTHGCGYMLTTCAAPGFQLQAIRGCKDDPPEVCDQTLFFDSVVLKTLAPTLVDAG
jgi:hypothetical protein